MRAAKKLTKDMVAILNLSEEEIADRIRGRNIRGISAANWRRAIDLSNSIIKTRREAWNSVLAFYLATAAELARQEPKTLAGIVKTVSPVELDLKLPTTADARALVREFPIEGQTTRQLFDKTQASDEARIRSSIRAGVMQDESPTTVAQRVVGTARTRGADGTTETTRHHLEALAFMMFLGISAGAKEQFVQDNTKWMFSTELYVATLDHRTTPICRSLDGNRYKIGEGPHPPIHWRCRSLRVFSLNGNALGSRPARNFTNKLLLREFGAQEGIAVATTRKGLPFGTRGRFDKFARGRMRELTGPIPGKTTYGEWLNGQSAAIQDDILGKTRGKLFRRGGLTLDRFVDRRGNEILLQDLARLEQNAFRQAGLDPEDFFR